MSKKRFDAAFALVLDNRVDEARQILGTLDRQFVWKRIRSRAVDGTVSPGQMRIFCERLAADIPEDVRRSLDEAGRSGVRGTSEAAVEATVSPKEAEAESVDVDAGRSAPDAGTVGQRRSSPPPKLVASLDDPGSFLRWISTVVRDRSIVTIDEFRMVQSWALVGIAAAARKDGTQPIGVEVLGNSAAGQFAHAIGLLDAIEPGRTSTTEGEYGRTVKIQRISRVTEIEKAASEISRLIIGVASRVAGDNDDDDYIDVESTRRTIAYVLVELIRNVLQHSLDPLGAVVGAQAMTRSGRYDEHPAIQIAVADSGVGLLETLRTTHHEIDTAKVALERSLWPHFSGKFSDVETGTSQNAGLGLFFVSEMTKLTSGRLLIASRGESLFLEGDDEGHGKLRFLSCGYPGTLVVFEVPKRGVGEYDAMISTIRERAQQRRQAPKVRTWLSFENPPEGAFHFMVAAVREDAAAAENAAKTILRPRLVEGQPVIVDFLNIDICTQSFAHALLFDVVRAAWAFRVRLYVRNASAAVRDALMLLESYAL